MADVQRTTCARRELLGAATLSSIGLLPRQAAANRVSLVAFIHTEITVKALEQKLGEALPMAKVVVVSRYRDFERLLPDTDAVLALRPTLDQLGLPTTAQGEREGKRTEPYLLVGTTNGIDPKTVASVGAVDILGYAGLRRFVSQVLGRSPKIKPVMKVADLLPLLQLNAAEAVLTPDRFFSPLKATTQMELHARPVGSAGLPALAALTNAGRSVLHQLRRATDVNALMGVDEWN